MGNEKSKKALIAMSGGVDSSVAALLTKEAGCDCIGCMMKLRESEETPSGARSCCTLDDAEDARAAAARIGIPFYVFNFTKEFEEKVVRHFIGCYLCGMTPNPCIECNKHLKFDLLFERALALGCDRIVTGHYARVVFENGEYKLKKATDDKKDQSYVLYRLTQEQLAHVLFPLGKMTKEETRRIAEEHGFVNARKPDSQDICFVPDGKYAEFIKEHTGKEIEKGNFIDGQGNVLGRHKGIVYYTVGQHKGLGLVTDVPLYVKAILPETNEIVLAENEDLFTSSARLHDLHFISPNPPAGPFEADVKIRYRHKAQRAAVTPDGNGGAEVRFSEPQRAVTPGQAAVFYDGDTVLGGGVIIA